MALRFVDSFDHYTTNAAFAQKWSEFNGAPAPVAAGGRFTNGLQHTGNTFWSKTLDAQDTWIVGMALRIDVFAAAASLISLFDGTSIQTDLRIDINRNLYVTRNGVVLDTGTTVLDLARWYYIEFKATISDAAGIAVVRIDGATEINLSSQDTKNTANATANKVRFLYGGVGSPAVDTFSMDDVYILDGTGSAPTNDFLGDVRVEAILPGGNGNSSLFDGSDGNATDNYLLVDEATPNSDTDYVESPDVSDKDTYAFGNLTSTAGVVAGVQVLPFARKTDAGARSIVSVARLAAVEVDSADEALSTTYTYLPDIREAKPGGGVWTITDVNDAEFGVKISV